MTLPSLPSTLPQLQELLEAANTAGPGPGRAAEAAGSGAGLGGPEATRGAVQDPAGAGMPPGPFPQSGEGSFLWGAACVRVRACVTMRAGGLMRPSSSGGKPGVDMS